jgi:hypothetical protein
MKEPAQNKEVHSIVEWKKPLKIWKKIPSWNERTRSKYGRTFHRGMKEPAQNTEEHSIVEWKKPLKIWKKIPSWNERTHSKYERRSHHGMEEPPSRMKLRLPLGNRKFQFRKWPLTILGNFLQVFKLIQWHDQRKWSHRNRPFVRPPITLALVPGFVFRVFF